MLKFLGTFLVYGVVSVGALCECALAHLSKFKPSLKRECLYSIEYIHCREQTLITLIRVTSRSELPCTSTISVNDQYCSMIALTMESDIILNLPKIFFRQEHLIL